jgi:hypothetical protein
MVRSYSHDWHESAHAAFCLERYNPDDYRLKPPPEEPKGPMEKLAWLRAEEIHNDKVVEAEADWEARWRSELGFDQPLMGAFNDYTERLTQLWCRKGFWLSQLARVIRSHLSAQNKDIWQIRRDRSDRMGPVIEIEARTFFFDDENLREGLPWQTFRFEGAETEIDNSGWPARYYGKHGKKTRRLRQYPGRKTEDQQRREARRG